MNNRLFRAVLTSLEYSLMFATELDSEDARRRLFNFVWYRRVYPFSVSDTRNALRYLEQHTELDISKLLPQPHSDELLRRVFSQLNRTLSKLPV